MGSRPPIVLERVRTGGTSATGRFRIGRQVHEVHFDGVAPEPATAPEAFAAIGRLMGMDTHQRVVSLPRLSPSFRSSIDTFQDVHLRLFPTQTAAPLHALRRRDPSIEPGDPRRVAAFFSGGVDSFDLLVEQGDAIDDLIFVRGFDVSVHDVERHADVLATVRAAAEAVGKPLLVIDTDLRDFSDPVCDWTWFVYAGLISVAMLLGRTHHAVLGAASVADRHLPEEVGRLRRTPFGNRRAHLRLEGRTATRVEKVAAVAASGLARDTLRVCWQNVPGTLNCGTCPKCTRTVVALAAVGGLGTIRTLPDVVDLEVVARHPAVSRSDRAYLSEIREQALANGLGDLADALARALAGGGPVASGRAADGDG